MLGRLIYFTVHSLVRIFRVVFWNWQISGAENIPPRGGGIIFAANHLSWTDVYLLAATLPLSYRLTWMAKHEVFENRFAAWFLHTNNVIPLRRGEADRAAYVAAKNALEHGAAMLLFPEGHRSPNHALIEGKSGTVRLAVRTGVPIIPLAIWGSEHGVKGAMLRRPIRVRIGQPYHPVLMDGARDQWEKLTEELMHRIADLLPEQYRGLYGAHTPSLLAQPVPVPATS